MANARAKDLDLTPDVIMELIRHGEKFGKQRLSVDAKMQQSGVNVNETLKDLLAAVTERPKEHEIKAQDSPKQSQESVETIELPAVILLDCRTQGMSA